MITEVVMGTMSTEDMIATDTTSTIIMHDTMTITDTTSTKNEHQRYHHRILE